MKGKPPVKYFFHDGTKYTLTGNSQLAMSHFHEIRTHLNLLKMTNVQELPIIFGAKEFDDGTVARFQLVHGIENITVFAPTYKDVPSGEPWEKESVIDEEVPLPVITLWGATAPRETSLIMEQNFSAPKYFDKHETPVDVDDTGGDLVIKELEKIGSWMNPDSDWTYDDHTYTVGFPRDPYSVGVSLEEVTGESGWYGPNLSATYWIPGTGGCVDPCPPDSGWCECLLGYGDLLASYTEEYNDSASYGTFTPCEGGGYCGIRISEAQMNVGYNWTQLPRCEDCGLYCMTCNSLAEHWSEYTTKYAKDGEGGTKTSTTTMSLSDKIIDEITGEVYHETTGSGSGVKTVVVKANFRPVSLNVTTKNDYSEDYEECWAYGGKRVEDKDGYENNKHYILFYEKTITHQDNGYVIVDGIRISGYENFTQQAQLWVSIEGDKYLLLDFDYEKYSCWVEEFDIYDFHGEPVYVFGIGWETDPDDNTFRYDVMFRYGFYYKKKMYFSEDYPGTQEGYEHELHTKYHNTDGFAYGYIRAVSYKTKTVETSNGTTE